MDATFENFLKQRASPYRLALKCAVRFIDGKAIVYPVEASTELEPKKKWVSLYNNEFCGAHISNGFVLIGDFDSISLKGLSNLKTIEHIANAFGIHIRSPRNSFLMPLIVINQEQHVESYLIYELNDGYRSVKCYPIMGDTTGIRKRSPDISQVDTANIAIIGLGSLGSKIAVSLARSGFQTFLLVDDDLFLPENLVRNELTWSDVGRHKVDALKDRIHAIAPDVEVISAKFRVGGQESANATQNLIEVLGEYDVIVDATAEPGVFNILANIVAQSQSIMVWAEVLAGGIGGMIGRSRPGVDRDPQTMRQIFLGYLANQPGFEGMTEANYRAEVDNVPIIASDADVGVIASYCTQMILDLFEEHSQFPFSLYLLGFREAWIFNQPLHNIPIDVGYAAHTSVSQEKEVLDEESQKRVLAIIGQLVLENGDATPDS